MVALEAPMGGTAALLAAMEQQATREKRARLAARLRTWGEWQREGYEAPGIDYARPRVIGNAPGSKEPVPEWYAALVLAISLLPWDDQRRLVFCYSGDGDTRGAGRAFEALMAAGMGEE